MRAAGPTALHQRPDLQSLAYNQHSAQKFARAQRDQMLPTISALGTAGSVPIRPAAYYNQNWWGSGSEHECSHLQRLSV